MSETVERVARVLFMKGKPSPTDIEYTGELWPDRCDEGSGPPFDADGWRELARAAIEEVRKTFIEEARGTRWAEDKAAMYAAADVIEEALK